MIRRDRHDKIRHSVSVYIASDGIYRPHHSKQQ